MDKSWMSKSRLSKAYIDGVEAFLKFANSRVGEDHPKPCPCNTCLNIYEKHTSDIRFHLYKNGIDQAYTLWKFHGESGPDTTSPRDYTFDDHDQRFDMDVPDDVAVTKEMVDAAREQYLGDPEKFQELLMNAEEPLYEDCSKHTRLTAVVKLFNWKAKNGWSDISFSGLLKIVADLLPKGNLLPLSMGEVKKIMAVHGMKYQKIHACPNDCVLYRNENEDKSTCPTCGSSRYKENRNKTTKSKGVPAKVLWYFPPIPRFKKMFQSAETAKNLVWHATEREVDDKLRHPADSPAWKLVDFKWPEFGSEERNLRLALSADGVNPHGSLSSRYSCWPVLLITYNLPPWLCMKRKFMLLTMLISGPRQPGNNIDVFFRPLIDDLQKLWGIGVEVYDSHRNQAFTLRAVLLWTINDFPALGNLSGHTVRGYYACPICSVNTDSERLKHSQKNVYRNYRRWLRRNHPYRMQKKAFNGEQELRSPPTTFTGEDILKQIEGIVNSWGNKNQLKEPTPRRKPQRRARGKKDNLDRTIASRRPRAEKTRAPQREETRRQQYEENNSNNSVSKCWKKKSVFFELEYWEHLLIRHNLDVMHIEKNVCESIIGTLLNIPGKTKDGLNSRLDLQELGIRKELAPEVRNGRPYLPPACYTLSRDEKIRVCKILHEVKVPDGYSSNFRSLVSMQDLKLYGLKSHDCHVLMQQLLPVAIRSVLPKNVRYAIVRLCFFFNSICTKVVDVPKLLEVQREVVVTLCMLEKYFPPSFFDIMVHLTIHLVKEVRDGGPVFFRWMYAFERNMTVLKGYVRNRNRPEGCIAENYIAEESVEFLSEFLPDLGAVGIPSSSNHFQADMMFFGNPPLGGKLEIVDEKSLEQAHHYVLQNASEVLPYIEAHIQELKDRYPRLSRQPTQLQNEHNRSFSNWLSDRVLKERNESNNNISESLRWLSQGPSGRVLKYATYVINGYRFSTKDRDAYRVNQNSGVSLMARTMQISSRKDKNPVFGDMWYYGAITEIWVLDYTKFHIPMFKCEWVDNRNGIKTDDLGFTMVDRDRVGSKTDPFILASQAKQVFYVNDEFDPKWSVVLVNPQRCYHDNDNDLIDGNNGDTINLESLPNNESFDLLEEAETTYVRDDCEGTFLEDTLL